MTDAAEQSVIRRFVYAIEIDADTREGADAIWSTAKIDVPAGARVCASYVGESMSQD